MPQDINKIIFDEAYWNAKHPKINQVYEGRPLPCSDTGCPMDVRHFIWHDDVILKKVIKDADMVDADIDVTAHEVQKFVVSCLKYVGDDKQLKHSEYWLFPGETMQLQQGDCVAGYEELYTDTGIKLIKDVKVGDCVLSYDFTEKCFVYKPVVKVWDKGKLPTKRVHLRNGQHMDITDKHPLWVRNGQKDSKYIKQYLCDIDLSKWWKRKLPIAKKIPYKVVDRPDLTVDHCFAIGHFVAEGWAEKSHVCTSGYDVHEHVIHKLEDLCIPFSEGANGNGVPIINYLESEFKHLLRTFSKSSFDIHIPEWFFALPEDKLEAFLHGFFIGDGHFSNYPDKRGYLSSKDIVYSTSCEAFAKDIQRMGLQLGRSFHVWKQAKHGGAGKHPIWRITYNPASHFLKDFGYKDASEVSISYVEDLPPTHMYDFTVEDTHTFVFKNGLISHQCEDGAILMASMLLNALPPEDHWRVRVAAGYVQASPTAPHGGHAYCVYFRKSDNQPVALDWCYFEDSHKSVADKPLIKNVPFYKAVWFSFNHLYAWGNADFAMRGRAKR